jgi:hypothetical protein
VTGTEGENQISLIGGEIEEAATNRDNRMISENLMRDAGSFWRMREPFP